MAGDGGRSRRFIGWDLPSVRVGVAPVPTAQAPPWLRNRPLPVQPELQERATRGSPDPTDFRSGSAFGIGHASSRTEKWEKVLLGGRKWGTVAPINRPEWRGSSHSATPVQIFFVPRAGT